MVLLSQTGASRMSGKDSIMARHTAPTVRLKTGGALKSV